MGRYAAAVLDAPEWLDVSFDTPCRVCGAIQGCSSMLGDEFARCLDHPSEWPLVTGGWLHRLVAPSEQPTASN